MAKQPEIILFHYPFSPYARRVIWYLQIRQIPYTECVLPPLLSLLHATLTPSQLQPPTLPRPDINSLGLSYRRIPILAIGRDIYLDTRLVLQKLEALFPSQPLSSPNPSTRAFESLLEKWTIEGGVFTLAAKLIPPEMPLLKDEKFRRDREEYTGRSWKMEDVKRQRPEALVGMRECWGLLEGLLGDGREWIHGGKEVGAGDIHAVWPFHWLLGLKGALPHDIFGKEQYPRTHAWIERFSAAVEKAKSSGPKTAKLKGGEMIQHITQADFAEVGAEVDDKDPLGLSKGQEVEVWPIDTGFIHRDRGTLVGLTRDEVVIAAKTKVGEKEIRIHAPRTGFRIQVVRGEGAKL